MATENSLVESMREAIVQGIITFSKNSGKSLEDAVVIRKTGEMKGFPAACVAAFSEHEWLDLVFGGENKYRKEKQRLISQSGKRYDGITIKFPDGYTMEVYFDITQPFEEMRKFIRATYNVKPQEVKDNAKQSKK